MTNVTAVGKKSTTLPVGAIWEVTVKAAQVPDVDDDTACPVRLNVSRPDGVSGQVVANATEAGYVARVALDVPGDYTASVVVLTPTEGGLVERDRLDGFTATAEPTDTADAPPDTTDAPPDVADVDA